jgi:hypothetical protein
VGRREAGSDLRPEWGERDELSSSSLRSCDGRGAEQGEVEDVIRNKNQQSGGGFALSPCELSKGLDGVRSACVRRHGEMVGR